MKMLIWMQKNWLFKFFSSARLAVPALLLLATVISVGTLIESRYNSAFAKRLVYDTWWFYLIILVIGITVLLSTISRLPWQRRHLGFLVTHLGMLTILSGAVLTRYFGIDGQLRVVEGTTNSQVVLADQVLEFAGDSQFERIAIPQSAGQRGEWSFWSHNLQLTGPIRIVRYLPFVELPQPEASAEPEVGTTLRFRLKSPFFDQEQWLNSEVQSEVQLGPARIRLNLGAPKDSSAPVIKSAANSTGATSHIIVVDGQGRELKKIPLERARKAPVDVNHVKIHVRRVYSHATVDNNKISEGEGQPNPALELEFEKGGKKLRDVAFAKFPEFSMQKDNTVGLRVIYKAQSAPGGPQQTTGAPPMSETSSNVIDFFVTPGKESEVFIRLQKNGKVVLEKRAVINEPLQTPWMGMTITVLRAGEYVPTTGEKANQEIKIAQPLPKVDFLPPSALELESKITGERIFLVEGQSRTLQSKDGVYQVYYGPKTIRLPFSLALKKFHKIDYPGTNTARSFASDIEIPEERQELTISMNEPLKKSGYTLYQASFDIQPNESPASIFSVNYDPGRWVKYLGSLIMALGIIIYTLDRSRLRKTLVANKSGVS